MFLRLGCLFVVVPLIELALLIWMGRVVGLWPTLALVAGTGLVGAALARREGMRALGTVQRELSEGHLPTGSLLSGAAVLVGSAFLLTPGVLTDVAGFFLLIPPTRRLAFRWAQARMKAALAAGTLSVSVWNMGRWAGSRGASEGGRRGGSGPHGRGTRLPFDFGPRSREEHAEETDLEDQGPRPGEIIQD